MKIPAAERWVVVAQSMNEWVCLVEGSEDYCRGWIDGKAPLPPGRDFYRVRKLGDDE